MVIAKAGRIGNCLRVNGVGMYLLLSLDCNRILYKTTSLPSKLLPIILPLRTYLPHSVYRAFPKDYVISVTASFALSAGRIAIRVCIPCRLRTEKSAKSATRGCRQQHLQPQIAALGAYNISIKSCFRRLTQLLRSYSGMRNICAQVGYR